MTDKEAMKLAKELDGVIADVEEGMGFDDVCLDTVKYVRDALAEQPAQQQEPVVWMYINRSTHETAFQKQMRSFVDHSQWKEVPLYSEPLANHEFQCVCGAVWCGDEMVHLPDKYPQPSKPLTVVEIMREWHSANNSVVDFSRAIEAAHGIKENT